MTGVKGNRDVVKTLIGTKEENQTCLGIVGLQAVEVKLNGSSSGYDDITVSEYYAEDADSPTEYTIHYRIVNTTSGINGSARFLFYTLLQST